MSKMYLCLSLAQHVDFVNSKDIDVHTLNNEHIILVLKLMHL